MTPSNNWAMAMAFAPPMGVHIMTESTEAHSAADGSYRHHYVDESGSVAAELRTIAPTPAVWTCEVDGATLHYSYTNFKNDEQDRIRCRYAPPKPRDEMLDHVLRELDEAQARRDVAHEAIKIVDLEDLAKIMRLTQARSNDTQLALRLKAIINSHARGAVGALLGDMDEIKPYLSEGTTCLTDNLPFEVLFRAETKLSRQLADDGVGRRSDMESVEHQRRMGNALGAIQTLINVRASEYAAKQMERILAEHESRVAA